MAILLGFAGISTSATAQTPVPNEWVWMGGSGTLPCLYNCGQPGVYGTLGVPAAQNVPGGRDGAVSWTDLSGNFWLFGGSGFASSGAVGYLNDLWKLTPSTNQWAWIGGSSTGLSQPFVGPSGVYGNLGTPAAGNIPGGRLYAASWTDHSGHLWLFGGEGYDGSGNGGMLNDLWEFDPASGLWTWIAGSNTAGNNLSQTAVYGTLGVSAAGNTPGTRFSAVSWTDSNGNFWLFGGAGLDANGNTGFLNDLWKFNPSASQWAWMGGSSTVPLPASGAGGQSGVYGTRGVAAAGNIPGGRQAGSGWTDSSGNLWLFGGSGVDAQGNSGLLNDLFEFSPATGQWAWVCGSNQVGDAGLAVEPCGDQGSSGTGYVPGSRSYSISWTGKDGQLWLFGGGGRGVQVDELNDVWVFDPSAKEWVWKGGSSPSSLLVGGVYGTLGNPAPGNTPGSRDSSSSWIDTNGNLWLFGGIGDDAEVDSSTNLTNYGYLNDLWTFSPSGFAPLAATPSFSVAPGTYTSAQSVTISDTSPSATIYYTTDGTTPTTASAVFSSSITVSKTETIMAIATANGYASSAISSATYTINLPPGFSVAASPASLTLTAGQSGSASISITPANGFSSTVSFACSGLPSGSSCTFSPPTLAPSETAASTTLTIASSASSAALHRNPGPLSSGAALAGILCCIGWRKRRRLSILVLILAGSFGLAALTACAGAASSTPPPHQPTTSTITVTATAGSLQHSTNISLTVN